MKLNKKGEISIWGIILIICIIGILYFATRKYNGYAEFELLRDLGMEFIFGAIGFICFIVMIVKSGKK